LRVFVLVFLGVSACHVRPPRQTVSVDDVEREVALLGAPWGRYEFGRWGVRRCGWMTSDADHWGPAPHEETSDDGSGERGLHVEVDSGVVVVKKASAVDAFDLLPWDELIPNAYAVGTRRVVRVDDGWLVAYASPFSGALGWIDEDGHDRRSISAARVLGFARAPSGTWLALAVGKARGGRGGVLALDHVGRGEYRPRLVAVLPVEPSPVVYDDGGRLVGFAEGFVFRVDERGHVENLHYLGRDVLRVASIVESAGAYYFGADCGVVRLVPADFARGYREEWWSPNLARTAESLSCVYQ
jgi:hypothetical protein